MQALLVLLIVSSISLLNASSYRSGYDYTYSYDQSPAHSLCKRLENRIYLLTVTFPELQPLTAAMRFQPQGAFDEIFSVQDGNSANQVGGDFAMGHRFGYYKCASKSVVRATGLGFLFKKEDVEFLQENGATVIHDYDFTFSSNADSFTGRVQFAVFPNGKNPFTTSDKPVFQGLVGQVKGEVLRFRKFFDLSKA